MSAAPILAPELQHWLCSHCVVASLAAADSARRPHLAMALGFRWLGGHLELLVDPVRGAELLALAQPGAPLAAVFSEPSTHRTLQLKGPCRGQRDAGPADQALAVASFARFAEEVQPLGFDAAYARAIMPPSSALRVVDMDALQAFEQTPGARAGTAL